MPYHAARPNQSHQELPAQGPYQCLPTRETKPKTKGSHMCLPLPNLTKSIDILCPRCETDWGIWLGHGALTIPYQSTDLAVCHYRIVLPRITGRGVKYTHNDHRNPTVPTHSGGPGLGLVYPGRHQSLEVVMRDPYVIAVNRTPQRIDAMFRFTIRWLITVNIIVGTFTLFNLYIYPEHIYERPEPILHSPHVDTLHPHEV